MKISLDLDGVLCDLSSSTLVLAHGLYRKSLISKAELRSVYMKALQIASPSNYLLPNDEAVIITARVSVAWEWTRGWLGEHAMGGIELICIADSILEHLWEEGQASQAEERAAFLKADAVVASGCGLHIDNNAVIVDEVRRRGVPALCVRG